MSWGKSMWGGTNNINIPVTKNLKLIHMPGAGTDGIDFNNIPKGCRICNVYEHEIPIAEYCIASILNWEINLINKAINFKKLDWRDSIIFDGPSHSELYKKTVGILGYGKIGKEIAKRLEVFGAETIGYTRIKRKKDNYLNKIYLSKHINNTANKLNYLIIACPLTNETSGFIDNKIFKLLRKDAVLINIARGGIINEKDLYNFLKKNNKAGAIIDTWFKYPTSKKEKNFKPSNFLFNKLDNVIMTPHISAWSEEMIIRRSKTISDNIEKLYNKKKLTNQLKF